jgi:hypothetical protein
MMPPTTALNPIALAGSRLAVLRKAEMKFGWIPLGFLSAHCRFRLTTVSLVARARLVRLRPLLMLCVVYQKGYEPYYVLRN